MYYAATKKLIGLAFALFITNTVFGQLNNCINIKEHPLILEIIDSVKTNKNYRSILAYTVINCDRIGLAKSTALNLAYAWAACEKIPDLILRKNEEFKYLDAVLNGREFERLIAYMEKRQI